MFRALKTSRDQTWTYNKHTHEGASPPNFFFIFLARRKCEVASATCQNTDNQDLSFRSWSPEHGVLPPRRENQKYLQLVRVTHPSSTLRTLIFPRAVFRFQKNDCYEQDPNILDLWAEFSSKLTMRGTFLWYRDVLLGSVWSSWWQQRQEIKTIFCVRLSKAHCLTLLTWSIIVVKH